MFYAKDNQKLIHIDNANPSVLYRCPACNTPVEMDLYVLKANDVSFIHTNKCSCTRSTYYRSLLRYAIEKGLYVKTYYEKIMYINIGSDLSPQLITFDMIPIVFTVARKINPTDMVLLQDWNTYNFITTEDRDKIIPIKIFTDMLDNFKFDGTDVVENLNRVIVRPLENCLRLKAEEKLFSYSIYHLRNLINDSDISYDSIIDSLCSFKNSINPALYSWAMTNFVVNDKSSNGTNKDYIIELLKRKLLPETYDLTIATFLE